MSHVKSIDSIIKRLINVRDSVQGGENDRLTEAEIRWLCSKSGQIFSSQNILLELERPVNIRRVIPGQHYDFTELYQPSSQPSYVFLGNFTRKQSLETVCLLLAYKIKYSDTFYLLRGTDDYATVNENYGFYDECKRRYSIRLSKSFENCFSVLPVAAVINGITYCCHGKVNSDEATIELIRSAVRPSRPEQGVLCELLKKFKQLWTIPTENTRR